MNWNEILPLVILAAYLLADRRMTMAARAAAPAREGFLTTLAGVLRKPRSDP
jgi:hypothetical protein